MDISGIFSKVRGHASSGLENQRQVAVLLAAIEQTIQEQNEPLVPLAYFGALMTVVDQQQKSLDSIDGDSDSAHILTASMYLLAMVFPKIPTNVLRLKFSQIADALVGLLESQDDQAPLVRSTIACLEYLLCAQDNTMWTSNDTCKRIFENLLFLTIDARPKVRRVAADVVRKLIQSVHSPAMYHPATCRTIEFCTQLLAEFLESSTGFGSSKAATERSEAEEKVLSAFMFLKSAVPVFASQANADKVYQKLDKLCVALLAIPAKSSSVGNIVLTQWVFQIFDALLGGISEESDGEMSKSHTTLGLPLLIMVVKRLLELSPYENDAALTPAWLNIIADGFQCLSDTVCDYELNADKNTDPVLIEFCSLEYPELVSTLFNRIFSSMLGGSAVKPAILQRATILLSVLINQAISNSMIDKAVQGEKDGSLLIILNTLNSSLSNIHFRDQWGYILLIAASMLERVGRSYPQLTAPTLTAMFAFRDDRAYIDSFPYKEELNRAIYAGIQSLGMGTFASFIPLNIENEFPDQPRRPYLLSSFHEAMQSPLSFSKWDPTQIMSAHTIEYFLLHLFPLAVRMLEKAGSLWTESRQLEAKLHETLGIQIFELLPLICGLIVPDIETYFGKLASHLGKLLQEDPEVSFPNLPSKHDFRPIVCESLQNLISTFTELAKTFVPSDMVDPDEDATVDSTFNAETHAKATAVIKKITVYSSRFLSTLCNNYTSIHPNAMAAGKAKGQALQVFHERSIQQYEKTIRSFLLIADKKTIQEYFMNIVKLLLEKQTELQMLESNGPNVNIEQLRMYAILDLMMLMIPFLPSDEQNQEDSPLQIVFKVLIGQLKDTDSTVQKKTYNALYLVLQAIPPSATQQRELFTQLFDDSVISNVTSGTRRSRTRVIQYLCETIVEKRMLLEVIPESLPEVILATKEVSEKSRNAAYACLVSFGQQMLQQSGDESTSSFDTLESSFRKELDSGVVDSDNEDMDATDRDIQHQATVSLKEYFLMVVAGLAATTSHMQSAAIASLGRLLFEFSEVVPQSLASDLVKTVLIAMQSKNKEVLKSALGFIKVAVVCLPQEMLEDDLEEICVGILEHSKDHKSHFRAKVRHIFERLIRKFSFEAIEGFVPESDKKLVNNIRKRRERLKKQKAEAGSGQRGDAADIDASHEPNGGKKDIVLAKSKGFDHVVNGSDSELGTDSEDDEAYIPQQYRDETRHIKSSGTLIKETNEDDIVDFLDRNVVRKVSAAPLRKGGRNGLNAQTSGKASSHEFKTNASGRLILNEEESEDEGANVNAEARQDYYKQSLESETAFVRTQDGRIKFVNKRKHDDDDDTATSGAATHGQGATKNVGSRWSGGRNMRNKKKNTIDPNAINHMLGRQYKAKHAQGDVKKEGHADPHAYIPLSGHVVGNMRKSTKLDDSFKGILKAAQKGTNYGESKRKQQNGENGGKIFSRSKANKRHK
ncbi:pre-rRNA processing protein [Batrachochytrium dendrobatidis]|nr:pre-rRNA processing protein [Batrachochytrium dendrobatidis]